VPDCFAAALKIPDLEPARGGHPLRNGSQLFQRLRWHKQKKWAPAHLEYYSA
jgi:hypothetical protein